MKNASIFLCVSVFSVSVWGMEGDERAVAALYDRNRSDHARVPNNSPAPLPEIYSLHSTQPIIRTPSSVAPVASGGTATETVPGPTVLSNLELDLAQFRTNDVPILGTFSEFCSGFNEELMASQPADVQNAHRDVYIRSAVKVAVNLGISRVGPIAGAASLAAPQARAGREMLARIDVQSVCPPQGADALYQAYIGASCQESFANADLILQAGERLERLKEKVVKFISNGLIDGCDAVGLTEENYNRLTIFVDNAMKKAPAHIKKAYQEFLAVSDAQASSSAPASAQNMGTSSVTPRTTMQRSGNNQRQNSSQARQKRIAKAQRQKEIVDASMIVRNNEDGQRHIAALLERHSQEAQEVMQMRPASEHTGFSGGSSHFVAPPVQFDYPTFRNNYSEAMRGLAALATIFNCGRSAQQIATLGSASIELMDACRSFSSAGALCGISPYVGALSAVASITALFGRKKKNDNNTAQVLLDAINNGIMHLSRQMEFMHKDIIGVREDVHQLQRDLSRHHVAMLEQFFAIGATQRFDQRKFDDLCHYVKRHHVAINDGLAALHGQAKAQFTVIRNEFSDIHIAEIDDLLEKSFLKAERETLSVDAFSNLIDKIFVKATSRASSASLTGDVADARSLQNIQTVLDGRVSVATLFSHPAFFNINLLSKASGTGLQHVKLTNPLVLLKCSGALLFLLEQKLNTDESYPTNQAMKDADLAKLRMLKEECLKITNFIKQTRRLTTSAREYQRYATQFCDAMAQEQVRFEQEETQKINTTHRAAFEAEQFQLRMLPTKFECTKCVEVINKTLQTVRSSGHNAAALTFEPACFFPGRSGKPEVDEALNLSTMALRVYDARAIFNRTLQEYSQALDQRLAAIRSAKLHLYEDSYNLPTHDTVSFLLYPEDQTKNLPILLLPSGNLPIDPVALEEEALGHRKIRHEYALAQNGAFCLKSYLVDCATHEKIKILELATNGGLFDTNPHPELGSLSEQIGHVYYGGRFPDRHYYISPPVSNHSAVARLCFNQKLGYYPPITPRPAFRDTFLKMLVQNSQHLNQNARENIEKSIQNFKKNKRLEFNRKIADHFAIPGDSPLSVAANGMDAQFKILYSLLLLSYNEALYDERHPLHSHFFSVRKNSDTYLKNLAGIKTYLGRYADANNTASNHVAYVGNHVAQTSSNIVNAVNAIATSRHAPRWSRLENNIRSIDRLIELYERRRIAPAQPVPSASESSAGYDLLVSTLMDSNASLVQEVSSLKEQMRGMQEQMGDMMALLVQLSKNKKAPKKSRKGKEKVENEEFSD